MRLKEVCAADVGADCPAILVPGHVHDPAFRDISVRGGRHESCPQAMTGEIVGSKPDLAGIGFDDRGAALRGEALDGADGVGGEDLLDFWPAVGVSLAWIALIGGFGMVRLARRDIS